MSFDLDRVLTAEEAEASRLRCNESKRRADDIASRHPQIAAVVDGPQHDEAERIRRRVDACLEAIRKTPFPSLIDSTAGTAPSHTHGVSDDLRDGAQPSVASAVVTCIQDGTTKSVSCLLDDLLSGLTRLRGNGVGEQEQEGARDVLQGLDTRPLIDLVRHARAASQLMEAELTRWRSGDNGAAQKAEAA